MSKISSTQIIDNLLTFITMKEMVLFGQHINEVQDDLLDHQWIKDALIYLKENGGAKTLAHSEWIKRHLG